MQDLYKGFKKTSEDENSATLEHDNGHALTIAKSGLSKKQKHALSKLPLHQAKGTKVPNELPDAGTQAKVVGANIADAVANKILEGATEVSTPAQEPQITPEQIAAMPEPNAMDVATGQPVFKRAPEFVEGEGLTPEEVLRIRQQGDEVRSPERLATEVALKQDALAYAPDLEEIPEEKGLEQGRTLAEQPAQVAPPAQPTIAPDPVMPEAAPQQPLLPQAAPALTDDERFTRTILDPNIPASQKDQVFLERRLKKQLEQDEYNRKFYEEMQKEQVSPKDLLHDRSTLGKIGTVIAMAFSGIGAGITGKENLVMQVLNDQINREIEAQKRSEEKKFNLHKFHNEQFQNSMAADLQLANDVRNVAKLKMEEFLLGSNPNDPIAKKRYAAMMAKLDADTAESNAKIAELRTENDVKKLLQAQTAVPVGQKSKVDPLTLIPRLVKDKDLRKRVENEIETRQRIIRAAPELKKKMEQAFNDYKGFGFIKRPESVKDLELKIRGLIPIQQSDDAGTKAQKTAVINDLLALLVPEKWDVLDKKDYLNRLQGWLKENTQITSATAQVPGLNLENFESTSIEGSKFLREQRIPMLVNGQRIAVAPDKVEYAKKKYGARLLK